MAEKIVIGPIDRGFKTNRLPFVIDNDSFPMLINAYQWRGRIKRKRGTSFLTRLTRFFNSTLTSYGSTSTITLNVGGGGNLLSGFSLTTLAPNSSIVPGSVSITVGATTYTDPTQDGYLTPTGTGGVNTINYATGAILIPAQAGNTATANFLYYPTIAVMGLEDWINTNSAFTGTVAFDTDYSYIIKTDVSLTSYDVSFYKNPPVGGTLPGYTQKTSVTPTTWNGQDYQQFWSTNYQGALWVTNGINVPFSGTNIGMQFGTITNITISAGGPPAIAVITIGAGTPLVKGDFVFINEVAFTTGPTTGITGINFQTGYVTNVAGTAVTVEFPNATIAGTYTSGGIVQYLTNRSSTTVDCIRWFDGDPTNGSSTAPTLTGNLGWVNFMPPLSQSAFSIADLPPAQYYLVGARIILPFKDRLLFFGPVVQTSATGASPIYLQDTVIYSQNGTPYYTASFTYTSGAFNPTLANTVFNPILVPTNQTASPTAYFEDSAGFGGFQTIGLDYPIVSASTNEDVIIIGMDPKYQLRMVYTGNDIIPFNFFVINSEFGTEATFSVVTLDKGVMTQGSRGFVITSQVDCQRFDLDIPYSVFQINRLNNGALRSTSQRDFENEWIYFSFPGLAINSTTTYRFPTQTLQYNYRDNSWGLFYEQYTTYGSYRRVLGITWATVGTEVAAMWNAWNEPWNSFQNSALDAVVIAGNSQGFVVIRDEGTEESKSLAIQSISGNIITSPDHCLNNNDYIVISGCLGTIGTNSPSINGAIFQVASTTTNTFVINGTFTPSGTYLGGGTIQRMYVPFIQTKQFPVSWGLARKTRLGVQQYLLTGTPQGQITLLIYLSQNSAYAYNIGPIIPAQGPVNDSLIYSTILYTCPESGNLGLTPPNVSLQMISDPISGSSPQEQIWHRINTSLIGDTVQLGFTMSDTQMRDTTFSNQFSEIELHGIILEASSASLLA